MFELTRELIDQIIFGMENQHTEYFLDIREKQVVSQDEIEEPDEDRYLQLPEWRSVDGYTLMERFVSSLNNPIFRERLREVLASGRGVFRQFKDTVKERREIERLWYNFKEKEMRKSVIAWYNELRDSWGLEPVDEAQIIETDELIASDFHFEQEHDQDRLERIAELDRNAFDEMFPGYSAAFRDWLYEHYRGGVNGPEEPDSIVISAETPSDEFAGFIWAQTPRAPQGPAASGHSRGTDPRVGEIVQIYVLPEFRGLGLATQLLQHGIEALHREGVSRLCVGLPGHSRFLAGVLVRTGFESLEESFVLDVGHWYRRRRG